MGRVSVEELGKFPVVGILQWLTDTMATFDMVVNSPQQHIFEDGVVDSIGLVDIIVAIEEKYGVDFSLKDVDREAWKTPAYIAQDIYNELAATR